MKSALITGINGMDGSHLADFLLDKGYEVYGMERRSSSKNRVNTEHLQGKVTFLSGDLTDQNSLVRCLKEAQPDEVYNLAAQSHVKVSFETPEETANIVAMGTLKLLEAIVNSSKLPFLANISSNVICSSSQARYSFSLSTNNLPRIA